MMSVDENMDKILFTNLMKKLGDITGSEIAVHVTSYNSEGYRGSYSISFCKRLDSSELKGVVGDSDEFIDTTDYSGFTDSTLDTFREFMNDNYNFKSCDKNSIGKRKESLLLKFDVLSHYREIKIDNLLK